MKHAPIQHAVEFFFFNRLRRAIMRRPHASVGAMGERLGELSYRLLGSKRRLSERNVARALPGLSESACREVVHESFRFQGRYYCEVLSCERFDQQQILDRFEIENWSAVNEVLEEGKGCYFHSGHFGMMEIALYPLAARVDNLWAVARPPDNPRVDDVIRGLRQRFGIRMIDKQGAASRLRTVVRTGGCVALVIDQHVRSSVAVQVPFFGHPAWTSRMVALFAIRAGVPIVPLACLPGDEPGSYRLVMKEPLYGEGRGLEAETELTRRIMASVEDDVRRWPEQYLWMHRRWRD